MNRVIAVVGATGQVGGALARALRQAGVGVRALGRNADRLRRLTEAGAEAHVGSLSDASFLAKALSGADGVFAMIPPDYQAPDHRAYQRRTADDLASAIERARVPRVVSLSSIGADLSEGNGPIGGLHDLEQRLDQLRGVSVLHLRPTYFMENHLHSIGLIKGQGLNGSPLKADHAFAMIATRDIGAAAAQVLTAEAPSHGFRELLGPRDYSMREATRILGAAVGRPDLTYVEFPYEETRKALVGMGFSADVARQFVEMYDGFNTGRIRPVQGRSADTTTPTTLEQFAREGFAPAYNG